MTTASTPIQRIEEAVIVSMSMVRAAKDGDWDKLMKLEHRRRRLIHAGAAAAGPASLEALRPQLVQLEELNEELLTACRQARASTADAIDAQRASTKARAAYGRLGKDVL